MSDTQSNTYVLEFDYLLNVYGLCVTINHVEFRSCNFSMNEILHWLIHKLIFFYYIGSADPHYR